MRFTIQYIHLAKIKPDLTVKMTKHIKKLRAVMLDCMQLLIVRKNKRDGNYTLLSGSDRYDYFKQHTNKKYAPCLVDESSSTVRFKDLLFRLRNRNILRIFPQINLSRLTPSGLSIIRAFIKQEPCFRHLSRSQQLKIIMMAFRYKKHMLLTMKSKMGEMNKL
jgi:hypothetical protein